MIFISPLAGIHFLDDDISVTGEEITSCSISLALKFKLEPKQPVAVFCDSAIANVLSMFAGWSVRGCVLLLSPHLSEKEVVNVLLESDCKTVLSDKKVSEKLKREFSVKSIKPKCLEEFLQCKNPSESLRTNYSTDSHDKLSDKALVLFTSGTTGRPKGVTHSFSRLIRRLQINNEVVGDAFSRSLCLLPLHFGHGLIGNFLSPLYSGNRVFLTAKPLGISTRLFQSWLEIHSITFMSSVPAFWRMALRASGETKQNMVSNLRIHIGSEQLDQKLVIAISNLLGTAEIYNLYGVTELCNWFSISKPLHDKRDNYIGIPMEGRFGILSEDSQVVSQGKGELLVKTPTLMLGYLNQTEMTSLALIADWFRTGDIGVLDADGSATILGRKKLEINAGGIKIAPEEIESIVMQFENVADCCTVGVADQILGEKPVCLITSKTKLTLDVLLLHEFVRANYKSDCVPTDYFFIEEMPINERGKVNRKKAQSLAASLMKQKYEF